MFDGRVGPGLHHFVLLWFSRRPTIASSQCSLLILIARFEKRKEMNESYFLPVWFLLCKIFWAAPWIMFYFCGLATWANMLSKSFNIMRKQEFVKFRCSFVIEIPSNVHDDVLPRFPDETMFCDKRDVKSRRLKILLACFVLQCSCSDVVLVMCQGCFGSVNSVFWTWARKQLELSHTGGSTACKSCKSSDKAHFDHSSGKLNLNSVVFSQVIFCCAIKKKSVMQLSFEAEREHLFIRSR